MLPRPQTSTIRPFRKSFLAPVAGARCRTVVRFIFFIPIRLGHLFDHYLPVALWGDQTQARGRLEKVAGGPRAGWGVEVGEARLAGVGRSFLTGATRSSVSKDHWLAAEGESPKTQDLETRGHLPTWSLRGWGMSSGDEPNMVAWMRVQSSGERLGWTWIPGGMTGQLLGWRMMLSP